MRAGSVVPAITVIGNVNVDLIVRDVRELPPPGEERPVETVELRPGGAAGNCALALAALGTPCRTVACVGDDHFGSYVREVLSASGLVLDGVRTVRGTATGVSIAFEAPERDRSFLTLAGSLALFDRSMVPGEALDADVVLFGGYFLLPGLDAEATATLMREARASGASVWLDTGWDPTGWGEPTRSELAALLPLVDVVLPNGIEAGGMSGVTEPRASAAELQGRLAPGGWAVVKLGPEGCVASGPDGALVTSPAPTVSVVDTTGAGDAFNAGLLAAVSDGAGIPEALGFAVRVASTVVGRPSSGRYPTRDEVPEG